MAKRSAPEVNAGSMADIAFLLLIFFLVTTTIEKDSGINRKLPPMEESEEDVIIKQKNIFTILINGRDELLVEDESIVSGNFDYIEFFIPGVIALTVLTTVVFSGVCESANSWRASSSSSPNVQAPEVACPCTTG